MRIIAGERRGTQLVAPKGMDTRPTQDKVKESLFSMLQGEVEQARVLDLFGGSGALALEALSRGASFAMIADVHREAMSCIRKNVEKLRYEECVLLSCGDWQKALSKAKQDNLRFDLVFLDPPYRLPVYEKCCNALAEQGLIQTGSLLVLEMLTSLPAHPDPCFVLWKERVYGETTIRIYHYQPDQEEENP